MQLYLTCFQNFTEATTSTGSRSHQEKQLHAKVCMYCLCCDIHLAFQIIAVKPKAPESRRLGELHRDRACPEAGMRTFRSKQVREKHKAGGSFNKVTTVWYVYLV